MIAKLEGWTTRDAAMIAAREKANEFIDLLRKQGGSR